MQDKPLLRILFVGDVFGRPGRKALNDHLGDLKSQYRVDCCIANGENAAGGKGITFDVVRELYSAGVDVVTLGNHAWDNKDVFKFIEEETRIVRPYNFPPGVPGHGFIIYEMLDGRRIAVAQLCCRLFMVNVDCPFRGADALIRELKEHCPLIIDLHGEATSEKMAMAWYVDGRVTALIGTHTHIPTADERILPRGTAYITDAGMTGAYDSVIGMDIETSTHRFITAMKGPFKIAEENVKISAVLITVDENRNRAVSIERIFTGIHEGISANYV